jgi:hypothetical protein
MQTTSRKVLLQTPTGIDGSQRPFQKLLVQKLLDRALPSYWAASYWAASMRFAALGILPKLTLNSCRQPKMPL